MNVNIHRPEAYDVHTGRDCVRIRIAEHAPDEHTSLLEGVNIFLASVEDVDRLVAAADEARVAFADMRAEQFDAAAQRCAELAPSSYRREHLARLVTAAEQAVRDDADVDEVIADEIKAIEATAPRWTHAAPVCSSMIPATAR